MNLEEIASKIEYPNTPLEIAKNEKIRIPVVKSHAYIKFVMEKESIDYNYDLTAALATAENHNLPTELPTEKYIERAIQELAVAELNANEYPEYKQKLTNIRKILEKY